MCVYTRKAHLSRVEGGPFVIRPRPSWRSFAGTQESLDGISSPLQISIARYFFKPCRLFPYCYSIYFHILSIHFQQIIIIVKI